MGQRRALPKLLTYLELLAGARGRGAVRRAACQRAQPHQVTVVPTGCVLGLVSLRSLGGSTAGHCVDAVALYPTEDIATYICTLGSALDFI